MNELLESPIFKCFKNVFLADLSVKGTFQLYHFANTVGMFVLNVLKQVTLKKKKKKKLNVNFTFLGLFPL